MEERIRGWEKNVRRVVPYTPGEQPKRSDIVKLNTNECPYPPAPQVQRVLEAFDAGQLRLYPDPEASALREALAARYRVRPEQVFVGVGSDDVLALAFLTFFNGEKPVLFPDVTYSFYDVWAKLYGIPYRTVALDGEWRLKKEDYLTENGGIIFPNPNAPTGLETPLDEVEEIAAKNPDSVVIVDEAYVDFGGTSALPLVERYDNLLVVQTFSKSRALAGLRIGFAIGSPRLIRYLNDVKFSFNSYTMNRLTIECGKACVEAEEYFQEMTGRIIRTREWAKRELGSLGFSFPDSRANFIFAKHESVKAAELFEALRREGIYVRYFPKPRIDDYLRITVGTQEEMERLITFLRGYLHGNV
ncbi:MAG: histidinol-phosphate transaminase [Eubacteriales bacterium]|nr:histidinol-phosphate transaminase [Eubacteriales bacterium]